MSTERHAVTGSQATQPDDTKMWAVHIIGPDDVHAVPNREIADAACVALNWSFKRQKLADMCRAEVIEWTHGYETWAAEKDLFRLEAVPSAEATQPTQAEAPSEREALRELVAAFADHRDAQGGWGNGHREQILKTESRLIKALAGARAALATQQAGQGEVVGEVVDMKYGKVRFYRKPNDPAAPYLQPGTLIYTTPPAPQQPEALAQQERDREDGK